MVFWKVISWFPNLDSFSVSRYFATMSWCEKIFTFHWSVLFQKSSVKTCLLSTYLKHIYILELTPNIAGAINNHFAEKEQDNYETGVQRTILHLDSLWFQSFLQSSSTLFVQCSWSLQHKRPSLPKLPGRGFSETRFRKRKGFFCPWLGRILGIIKGFALQPMCLKQQHRRSN